mmetsp:Transcript_11929/g.22899  ORF Transcript_11929/g.22899 Transcript_11929/m.22899 type:complete len:100 (+) Transcript_11929:207-506(+)
MDEWINKARQCNGSPRHQPLRRREGSHAVGLVVQLKLEERERRNILIDTPISTPKHKTVGPFSAHSYPSSCLHLLMQQEGVKKTTKQQPAPSLPSPPHF